MAIVLISDLLPNISATRTKSAGTSAENSAFQDLVDYKEQKSSTILATESEELSEVSSDLCAELLTQEQLFHISPPIDFSSFKASLQQDIEGFGIIHNQTTEIVTNKSESSQVALPQLDLFESEASGLIIREAKNKEIDSHYFNNEAELFSKVTFAEMPIQKDNDESLSRVPLLLEIPKNADVSHNQEDANLLQDRSTLVSIETSNNAHSNDLSPVATKVTLVSIDAFTEIEQKNIEEYFGFTQEQSSNKTNFSSTNFSTQRSEVKILLAQDQYILKPNETGVAKEINFIPKVQNVHMPIYDDSSLANDSQSIFALPKSDNQQLLNKAHTAPNVITTTLTPQTEGIIASKTNTFIKDIEPSSHELALVQSIGQTESNLASEPEPDIQKVTSLRPMEQVMLAVKHGARKGDNRISVNLHPKELGRVEVQIEVRGGIISDIKLYAEQDTLDILIREAKVLEQSLREIVKSDGASLSFNLKDGNHSRNYQDKMQEHAIFMNEEDKMQGSYLSVKTNSGVSHHSSEGLVDIRV